jgi:hypothetical protein
MKLIILSCEIQSEGSYLVSLQYGGDQIVEEVTVLEGVVPYLQFSEYLQEILHKDVGSARNMNQWMFKIHRQEAVDFPIEVGEF